MFEAVGNYFETKLVDFGFKLDPPAGPREITVCFLDGKTVAVADRAGDGEVPAGGCPARLPVPADQRPGRPGGGMGQPGMGPGWVRARYGGSGRTQPAGRWPAAPAHGRLAGGRPWASGHPRRGRPGRTRQLRAAGPGYLGPGLGHAAGGGPRVFAANPTPDVDPELKAMLNQMAGPKPIFNFAAK